ncbi:hypothetical protein NMG60_11018699 [Bertholletia excelsa]
MTAEEEQLLDHLRGLELRLVRCSLPAPSPPSYEAADDSAAARRRHSLHFLVEEVVTSIEAGDYVRALSSDAVRTIFKSGDLSSSLSDGAGRFYSELVLEHVEFFLFNEPEDGAERCYRAFLVMTIAVAAFLAFTQCNVTGPVVKLPPLPLAAVVEEGGGLEGAGWERWAQNELMAAGSDLLAKFCYLQYVVFAKILFVRMKDLLSEGKLSSMDGLRSISWWLARLILLQQRMSEERSSSLFDLLQVYTHETLNYFGTSEKVTEYWGSKLQEEEALSIVSTVHVEAGMMEHAYGRVDSSRLHAESAEVALGLQLSVTGALGFRTAHQVEPRAQRLLVAKTSLSDDSLDSGSRSTEAEGERGFRNHSETSGASDVLMTPRFIEDNKGSENGAQGTENGGTGVAPLKAIQQAVVLAKCLFIEKSTPHDEMQGWEMAPYIEAIDSQMSSYFIIRCFCDILRIRWESTRSRTKERALLMMDKLAQGVYESSPAAAQRIYFCFAAYVPTIPALRKEYGELLVSCGLIGEAVKVFEDLELWDNLIYCYCLLGKKAAAVELINMRLSQMPNDPRLWCSLGDITNNDAYYEKALEVSGNKSSRAKRSLARNAYNSGEYEKSKVLWESAMALNSLYPNGWFALGAAALKARDVEKALDAFTFAVQVDPENGEAWNNIACLHMIKKRNKEAFIAFKEALKFKRNNWQLWENFSYIAAEVGNFNQALQAVQMVLDLTSNKRIDVQFLERMILEIEQRALARNSQSPLVTDDHNRANEICCHDSSVKSANGLAESEAELAKTHENEYLDELVGKVLQQVVRSGGSAEIWGLYARWHKLRGDLTMCSEALLKQVRSYQGSDLWKDRDRFKKFAPASLELCKVYMERSSCTGGRRELLAAEMHLKNVVKQAGNFSDMEEFRDLQTCLEEVQMKLQASSAPST